MFDLYFRVKDQTKINATSSLIVKLLLDENPILNKILIGNTNLDEVYNQIRTWVFNELGLSSFAYKYYTREVKGREALRQLSWKEIAAIRILDYIDNSGIILNDANADSGSSAVEPFKVLWFAANYQIGGGTHDFFIDMLHLFRQFNGIQNYQLPSKQEVLFWMDKHHSGLEPTIVEMRKANQIRISKVIVKGLEGGKWLSKRYVFSPENNEREKLETVLNWWNDWQFHLKFAVRDPETLNEMLDYTLSKQTMQVLIQAKEAGIPFFVNPYYLSLLNVNESEELKNSDKAIWDYVFYSKALIESFGTIQAWEKEDLVKPGEPNEAGWILPSDNNVHRRYPEVAILIPETMGRACGGLCVSCQRMYDFQSGHLNFNLEKLKPNITWSEKLGHLMRYFEEDSKLRDILITGGDAFMNTDKQLKELLDAVFTMAVRKKKTNENRAEGEKFAEMQRIRLGTRLPVYLPQRITDELIEILAAFKAKASKIGFKQFVVQTHFISSMEITPEAKVGIKKLESAGWMVANQMVFTAAASIKGHAAKLRQELNNIGVVPYYTFSIKGFKENSFNFATNARAVQESVEEKVIGQLNSSEKEAIKSFPLDAENMTRHINKLRDKRDLPFLATDRNVMNIPGVGKSLSYRVIGITKEGHRVLEFEHDHTRSHSPIVDTMGNFKVIESKSIAAYLKQIEAIGENPREYEQIYGYSIGETEQRMSIYEYPEFDFKVTDSYTNLQY